MRNRYLIHKAKPSMKKIRKHKEMERSKSFDQSWFLYLAQNEWLRLNYGSLKTDEQ